MDSQNERNGRPNVEQTSTSSAYQNTTATIKSLLEEILQTNPSAAKSALAAATDTALRAPCYCEENVWRLAFRKLHQQIHSPAPTTFTTTTRLSYCCYHVVFVSNPKACVPMFHQRASSSRDSAVYWDYHVLLISSTVSSSNNRTDDTSSSSSSWVWDMDSHLPCPCPLNDYLETAFAFGNGRLIQNQNQTKTTTWPSYFAPYFRVVDAETFLRHFSSDRSHMKRRDGSWSAPPPIYDCIIVRRATTQSTTVKTSTAAASEISNNTLWGYMTISNEEVAVAAGAGATPASLTALNESVRIGEQNGEDEDGDTDVTATAPATAIFGSIYSLSQLRQRFG